MSRSRRDTKNPPRWLDRFLEFYCRKDKVEDLQGDLYEYFYRNLDKGYRYATFIYFIDVLKFLRIYTVKQLKITTNMNFLYLFQNYFKTAVRSLQRNKLFSFINIAGLSISMSVAILLLIYVSDLLTYDHFHEQKDRIVRLTTSTPSDWAKDGVFRSSSTWIGFGPRLQQDYDGVAKQVTFRRNFGGQVSNGKDVFPVRGHYASEDFFDVFSFEVLEGDPQNALSEPNSLVLTETTARKIFGDQLPIGEVITVNQKSWILTAVIKEPPYNSHLKFEGLASLSTYVQEATQNEPNYDSWDNMWMFHTYLLLDEKANRTGLQAAIDQISDEKNAQFEDFRVDYHTQAITDIVPGDRYGNEIADTMEWTYIYVLFGLSLLVTLAASFNYTNLSIARALRRSKEVSVRKVIGATRTNVLSQFIVEAVLTSFIATIFGYLLFFLLKDQFIAIMTDQGGALTNMTFQPYHVILILAFAVFTGLLAGILPSVMLSRLKASAVMKDASAVKLSKGINLRRVLIVFQFVLSIGFIIVSIITARQYIFSINYDIGIETENIINFRNASENHATIKNQFTQVPDVAAVSRSAYPLSTGYMWSGRMKYDANPLDSFQVYFNYVDSDFIPMHGIKLLAGESYPRLPKGQYPKYAVINDKLAKKMGFLEPADALGQTIEFEKIRLKITGVTQDFQHMTALSGPKPFLFLQNPGAYNNINVKLATNDNLAALNKLERIWEEESPLHAFEPEWYKDNVRQTYSMLISTMKVVGFISVLVIIISSLGLLGIAVFTSETRMKEISIRKVMGASATAITYLLSRSYLILLVIAAVIGMPLAYYVCEEFILVNYTNRIQITVFDFVAGISGILFVGLLTIGWQVWTTARQNPSETLRDE